MVGGKVVQVYQFDDKQWVNVTDDGEYCAVIVSRYHAIRLGDKLWWQGNICYWTSKSGAVVEEKVDKLSASGVPHPMGSEYEIKHDFYPAFKRLQDENKKMLSVSNESKATITITPVMPEEQFEHTKLEAIELELHEIPDGTPMMSEPNPWDRGDLEERN